MFIRNNGQKQNPFAPLGANVRRRIDAPKGAKCNSSAPISINIKRLTALDVFQSIVVAGAFPIALRAFSGELLIAFCFSNLRNPPNLWISFATRDAGRDARAPSDCILPYGRVSDINLLAAFTFCISL